MIRQPHRPSGPHWQVSVMVVAATDLVKEAQARHGMAPTAVAALGRLLMGTLLLGAMKGPDESVQVTVNGRGPIGQITAVSALHGEVKGFAVNPLADPPLNSKGKMDVGGAVGKGVLSVIRTHPSWQSPYTGTVPLVSGEIAEDLANYLAESEQINSAMGLGVAVGKDGIVRAAGGFLVQVLPFCSDETLDKLEANVQSLGAMSDAVQRMDAGTIAHYLLQGLDPEPVIDPIVPTFGPCGLEDLKPRMLRAVESLGAEDVKKLIEERASRVSPVTRKTTSVTAKKTTTKSSGLGVKKLTTKPNDSLYEQKPVEAPVKVGVVEHKASRFTYNEASSSSQPGTGSGRGGHVAAPAAAGDFFNDFSGGIRAVPSNRPKPPPQPIEESDEARRKFAGAKAISSQQFFDRDNKELQAQNQERLQKFQNSSAISSAAFFDRDEGGNQGGGDGSLDSVAADLLGGLSVGVGVACVSTVA
ncbi:unnamed protein product [Closterium sp. NIES-65]|nr:unnamed protein product [Closterium sp. NIES-65]CAI6008601.1 unnamed protein product [Closterium sp. NIES-65]